MSAYDPKRTLASRFAATRNGSEPHFADGKSLL
jgi:hypothetical protein